MPIQFTNYVDIISSVGGNGAVRQRELIPRIFTENPLVPTGSFIEFQNNQDGAANVGDYFGTNSTEYLIAQFVFSWISKNNTTPQKISFGRWANVATAPQIFGDPDVTQALASWTPITSGAFILTMGGFTFTLSGLNFSGAGSLSAVAAIIQAAVRAESGGGAEWTSANVTYDSVRGSFNLTGGITGAATIAVSAGLSGDIAGQLGWLAAGTILSNGVAAESLTQTLTNSANLSTNFGAVYFIPALNITQNTEIATWIKGQNVRYMFCLPAVDNTAANLYWTDLQTYDGTGVTLSPSAGQYPELIPAMILAATDYNAQNSVQNYMFQQNFEGITASVTDTNTANAYDIIRTNYYGNTQTAGQILTFYQRGVLMGGSNAAVDMNVYANEMWLKDAAGAAILTLLLSLSKVSANKTGQAQILSVLQSVVDAALFNGTISVGKTLNAAQKLFITQISGSDKAWQQVQTIGYWLNCAIVSFVTEDGRTEFKAVYTLIYSKDDTIRKVDGSHILI